MQGGRSVCNTVVTLAGGGAFHMRGAGAGMLHEAVQQNRRRGLRRARAPLSFFGGRAVDSRRKCGIIGIERAPPVSGQPGNWLDKQKPMEPSLGRVAVSAFHNNRHRKGSDMYCNPHGLTPSRVVGLNPPTVLWQRLPVVYTGCRNFSTGANRGDPGVPHRAVWGNFCRP